MLGLYESIYFLTAIQKEGCYRLKNPHLHGVKKRHTHHYTKLESFYLTAFPCIKSEV